MTSKEGAIVRLNSFVIVSVAGVGLLGCGHSYPPPQDLIAARTAVARASAGPARQLSPARLRLAKQALGSAEMTYGAAPEQEVRDRAYVAIRQAEAAEAEASAAMAAQRREKVLSELASMGGEKAAQARAQLMAAEQRASDERLRADTAQQQATAEGQRAEENQRQASEARQQLTAEQKARAEAEARAQQAFAELEKVGNVRREARGIVVTLSGQVLFATGKSTLLPAAEASLDSVSSALKALPPDSPPVIIEGHTDSTGSRGFNMELSERRAQAVRDYLAGKGVSSQKFTVRGLGPDRPVAANSSPEGRANNRRVEIVIPPPEVAERAPSPSTGLTDPLAPTVPAPRPTTTSPSPGTFPPSPSTPSNPGPTPPNPNPTPSNPDLPPSPSTPSTPSTPVIPGTPTTPTTPRANNPSSTFPSPGPTPPTRDRTPTSPSDVPPDLTPPAAPVDPASPPATGPRNSTPPAPGPTPPSRGGPSPKAGPQTPSPVPGTPPPAR
jgi:outer membrane protein OmpA-like peptidoglycan-associated protein